jgi:hypothetical protein
MVIIAYLTGVLTVPTLFGAYFFFNWAFGRTQALGNCLACEHLAEREIGDNYNVVEWLRGKWHDIWWSPRSWHHQAVKEYWAKYS